MKQWIAPVLRFTVCAAVLLVLAAVPVRHGSDAAPALRVALFVNGTLGDKSFYDSAARGLRNAAASLGLRARVVEGGYDPTRWESAFADLAEGDDFDVIVAGSFTMVSLVERLAARYPRTRFIVFDAAVDYRRCACANVHSILFRQNEGAYLAGHLAARIAAPAGVGVVGGMQIPVIDDFIAGFTAGARAADPRVPVMRQYVNSFTDPATAKEIAKALYAQGAGALFHAAGASGQGVIEAAADAGRPVIGVDSDQYAVFKASSPRRARQIITSVLKNVDVALERALVRHRDGTLAYGQAESLGVAEGGIGLAEGSEWMAQAPAALRAELAQVQADVAAGRINVPSAFAPR